MSKFTVATNVLKLIRIVYLALMHVANIVRPFYTDALTITRPPHHPQHIVTIHLSFFCAISVARRISKQHIIIITQINDENDNITIFEISTASYYQRGSREMHLFWCGRTSCVVVWRTCAETQSRKARMKYFNSYRMADAKY